MLRRRTAGRIRPSRTYRSRTGSLATATVIGIVALWASSVWFDRASTDTVALAARGPYRVQTVSGPLEVVSGAEPAVEFRSSWLVRGPTVATDAAPARSGSRFTPRPSDIRVSCETSWPCATSMTVTAPTGAELHVGGGASGLSVTTFDGVLSASTVDGGDLILGPVRGRARLSTGAGAVTGYGVMASELEIVTSRGPIDVEFGTAPRTVSITAGDGPVRIVLPDASYAVTVEGATTTAVGVRQDPSAPRRVGVVAAGSVVIERSDRSLPPERSGDRTLSNPSRRPDRSDSQVREPAHDHPGH